MSASIYGFVLRRLGQSRGNWQSVADGSGVSKRTIEKIFRKEIADPGVSHIEKLYNHFKRAEVPPRRKRAA